jgi:hypothetical protein
LTRKAAPEKCAAEREASQAQQWPINLFPALAILPRTFQVLL